jgi:S-DNA-T family DNA segregation ATPase FtsK/SpoIIIE
VAAGREFCYTSVVHILMAKRPRARVNAEEHEPRPVLDDDTRRGISVVVLFVLAIISALSFLGLAGAAGQGVTTALGTIFGWTRFAIPVALFVWALLRMQPNRFPLRASNGVGLFLFFLSLAGLSELTLAVDEMAGELTSGRGGGVLGLGIAYPLVKVMGVWASLVVLLALFIIAVLVLFSTSLDRLAEHRSLPARIFAGWREFWSRLARADDEQEEAEDTSAQPETAASSFATKPVGGSAQAPSTAPTADGPAAQLEIFAEPKTPRMKRPSGFPLDLLDKNGSKPTSGNIEENKAKIKSTFENFGIQVEMGGVNVGPTVTQFTLKPAEGVKLSQIVTLGNDLALALAAHPIRIEAPIPGQSLVGIEVPNKAVARVNLRSILESDAFKKRKSNLTIALGQDVAGQAWVANVNPLPHLLIAGSTGSGKSVMINSVILSLLAQNSPDDLKFIMVDPKRVELTLYNGIPHLMTPVITETKKTINALRWVVGEMDRRFQVLSHSGKRNIQSYHTDVDDSMPYIVVIIDELADLMSVAAQEVESAIIRLAQMARAVGIHLIVATQRPSVDVITGLIKANITARIAFNVASTVDSRTILDTSGAEKLLGKGDMLFQSAELSKPKRLQGAFVSDEEIQRVVEQLKQSGQPDYDSTIVDQPPPGVMIGAGGDGSDEEDGELLAQAKDVIFRAQKASASLLQRRLRVGYARAARLLDLLEGEGFIGPGEGAKPRQILATRPPEYAADEADSDNLPSIEDAMEDPAADADDEEREEPERIA